MKGLSLVAAAVLAALSFWSCGSPGSSSSSSGRSSASSSFSRSKASSYYTSRSSSSPYVRSGANPVVTQRAASSPYGYKSSSSPYSYKKSSYWNNDTGFVLFWLSCSLLLKLPPRRCARRGRRLRFHPRRSGHTPGAPPVVFRIPRPPARQMRLPR